VIYPNRVPFDLTRNRMDGPIRRDLHLTEFATPEATRRSNPERAPAPKDNTMRRSDPERAPTPKDNTLATERAPAPPSSMADMMQDLVRPAPAPKPLRQPLSQAARGLCLTSNDPSMYETKWLNQQTMHEAVLSGVSPPPRRTRSLDIDHSAWDMDDVDLSGFAKCSLDDVFTSSSMPHRPKYVSMPKGGTVPSPASASGGRSSMSLP